MTTAKASRANLAHRYLHNWLSSRIAFRDGRLVVLGETRAETRAIWRHVRRAVALRMDVVPGSYLPRLGGYECDGCGERFHSVTGFAFHRTGPLAERVCRDADDLRANGYERNERGQWVTTAPYTGPTA
jgi:hypothetical protein